MRKFKQIDIGKRKDTLYAVLTGKSKHIFKLPVLSSDTIDEHLINSILTGLHFPNLDVIENKDGSLNFSTEEDFRYMSSIANFYFNKYSVDGYYFKDLSPLEQNIFENSEVVAITLRMPYSADEILQFQTRIR